MGISIVLRAELHYITFDDGHMKSGRDTDVVNLTVKGNVHLSTHKGQFKETMFKYVSVMS